MSVFRRISRLFAWRLLFSATRPAGRTTIGVAHLGAPILDRVRPMTRHAFQHTLAISLTALFLAACGGEGAGASTGREGSAAGSDQASEKTSRRSKGPRWVIAIEGLPQKSGGIITAATMGGSGRYSLGTSGFMSSIRVTEDDPKSHMIFTFSEENVRCASSGDATATIDGDRAVVGGSVKCMSKDGGGAERDAAIEGWFELKK